MVICHGLNASKEWGFFPHVAERLARAGFTAVSFTFPGTPVPRELAVVLESLVRGEWGVVRSALGLFGHSLGGAIAVQRAATDAQVGALVTWGTAASPDVLGPAAAVRAPWLIVHGDRDESVPVRAAHDLKKVAPAAELLVVKGGSHTFSVGHRWQGPTRALELAMSATVDWFARHLA